MGKRIDSNYFEISSWKWRCKWRWISLQSSQSVMEGLLKKQVNWFQTSLSIKTPKLKRTPKAGTNRSCTLSCRPLQPQKKMHDIHQCTFFCLAFPSFHGWSNLYPHKPNIPPEIRGFHSRPYLRGTSPQSSPATPSGSTGSRRWKSVALRPSRSRR